MSDVDSHPSSDATASSPLSSQTPATVPCCRTGAGTYRRSCAGEAPGPAGVRKERPMIDASEAEELIQSCQQGDGDLSGERALMFAILRDAVCCIVEGSRKRHYRA